MYISKYDEPAAVILSIDEYRTLTAAEDSELEELTHEYDTLLARMQTPEAAAGIDALFAMKPAGLGDAAMRGARRPKD